MKHHILLVDDSPTNIRILERMLADLGHDIISATSGDEALRLAEEYDFSVILMDVRMPGMDGYEVVQRLRERSGRSEIPVIFVTALAGEEKERLEGYSAGAVDYLIKPVEPAVVRSKVRVFCSLQEKEKKIEEQLHQIEAQNKQLEQQLEEMRVLEEARMESEIRYRSLVALSPQAIVVQVNGELVFYNATAIQMLGSIDEESMYRRPFHTFVRPEDREMVASWVEQIVRRGGRGEPIECVLDCHTAEHVPRHVEIHACCILYDDELGVQMAVQDITDHKLLEDRLRLLSQVDGLTGLWNRRSFDKQLELEWRRLTRSSGELSILMIDLDQFKRYNDIYGHLEGDACLQAVAKCMQEQCCRAGDLVARYGGEEFIIILPETGAAGAAHIADNVLNAVRRLDLPHEGNKSHGIVTISCGVGSRNPEKGSAPKLLIQAADSALYQCKAAGGNCVSTGGDTGSTPL